MNIERYSDELKFSHFDNGMLSDRELYVTKKPNDRVAITLEDGEYYSRVEMTEDECVSLIEEFAEFMNKKINL